jgi:hypothetical protein
VAKLRSKERRSAEQEFGTASTTREILGTEA